MPNTTRKKFTKAEVKFEHPGMGKQKCKDCVHFTRDAPAREACDIVQGLVYPRDWCNQWKRKKGTNQ